MAAAVGRIRGGEIEKVVLAREVLVRASAAAHDPAARLRGDPGAASRPASTSAAAPPEAAFIGASPELLVRCFGPGVSTVGLAGSTRRSSDPAVDDHLAQKLLNSTKDRGEQEIVVQRIVKALGPSSSGSSRRGAGHNQGREHPAPGDPDARPAAEPRTAIELAGLLHPTPAVGGEPWKKAGAVMEEVEEMDRGWYAAPVGWMDGAGDGEFCVGSAAPCCATARPTSTPASASSPTPTRRPSWPRPRSSWGRCCRCWRINPGAARRSSEGSRRCG